MLTPLEYSITFFGAIVLIAIALTIGGFLVRMHAHNQEMSAIDKDHLFRSWTYLGTALAIGALVATFVGLEQRSSSMPQESTEPSVRQKLAQTLETVTEYPFTETCTLNGHKAPAVWLVGDMVPCADFGSYRIWSSVAPKPGSRASLSSIQIGRQAGPAMKVLALAVIRPPEDRTMSYNSWVQSTLTDTEITALDTDLRKALNTP